MHTVTKSLFFTASLFGLTVTISAATLVYEQPFNRPSYGYIDNISGWDAYRGATAADVGHNAGGNPTVQNSEGTGDGSNGRIYAQYGQGAPLAIVGTSLVDKRTNLTNFDFSIGQYEIGFDTVQSSTVGRVQLLIKIDSNWYISNQTVTPYNTGSKGFEVTTYANYHVTFNFTADKSAWSSFTLIPSTGDGTITPHNGTMAIGSSLTSNLTSTNVTGIGFYLTNTHSTNGVTLRLDTLTISQVSVPEPTTCALLLGGIILMGVTLRRIRQR